MTKIPLTPNSKVGARVDLTRLSQDNPWGVEVVPERPTAGKLGDWDTVTFYSPETFVEVKVPSSSGEDYYGVVVAKSGITCHCKSYSFRQTCKHVSAVKEELEKK